mmetsp:Transcript_61330/g.72843  ORF Transcript_61330/g.72843 Transcript_61330/m.72843 type:complete len:354 (+) Transcript_61330:174-1235(+)|eukprot:CAMPEP_0172510698 /NCGR_PEP_ID=MMETSP1066-20121228/230708_1 /TAXON_ID=671091 /ORGANISM="Coscinodiscus wailesii, Strain CCMP2513" /LENGTH=353 /DNA_ID=CAMNT_0013289791 /DNA_START=174 /DNA_END=1238 /DNA_ORIENTATION=-
MPKRKCTDSTNLEIRSLLDLPAGWERTLSLSALKRAAACANFEQGWQAVGSKQRSKLVAALTKQADIWRRFVDSVLPFDSAVEKGHFELKRNDPRQGFVEKLVAASVHLVPSGSGVYLGGDLVLTCAHCVDHDDDDERTKKPPSRIGRFKTCVTARGAHTVAECVSVDESNDLALLRMLPVPGADGAPVPEGLEALAIGRPGDDSTATAVLAVGNPHDWDLELSSGAAPRQTGYTPFWISAGKLQGEIAEDVAASKGVGSQRHSCWTYWGHSGCPIARSDGYLVALHNSWDDSNCQRHAVPLRAIRAFVARYDESLCGTTHVKEDRAGCGNIVESRKGPRRSERLTKRQHNMK